MGRYYYDEHEPTSSYYREPEKERCCSRLCSWVCNILCLAQVAAALYVAWLLLGRPDLRKFNPDDFTHVLGNLTDKDWDMGFNEDPYVGDNSTQIWKGSKGKGLSLQLQNALDDTWQTEFEAAVGDWKESNTLELTVVNVDVDYSCTPVDGVMVVSQRSNF